MQLEKFIKLTQLKKNSKKVPNFFNFKTAKLIGGKKKKKKNKQTNKQTTGSGS